MSRYRRQLPQLEGGLFLADGGIETDLIFNKGIEIREFAAHTLLREPDGRAAMESYFRGFLSLARTYNTGFILDSQTWKAHMHWADDLGESEEELRDTNRESILFISGLREEYGDNSNPVVLNALIGPTSDAYSPEDRIGAKKAETYHLKQLGWLADTEVDMVTGTTLPRVDEAIGMVRAARTVGLPIVISFTVETNGCLPSGRSLGDAIRVVDESTDCGPAYYMVNCAHPDHFFNELDGVEWTRRIRGFRCNASRLSHAELDACDTLDDGSPEEFGKLYGEIFERMPWLTVFGGCCGSDLRHITQAAQAIKPID